MSQNLNGISSCYSSQNSSKIFSIELGPAAPPSWRATPPASPSETECGSWTSSSCPCIICWGVWARMPDGNIWSLPCIAPGWRAWAQCKEKKGSNFAIWQSTKPEARSQKPEGPNTYALKIWLSPSGNQGAVRNSCILTTEMCKIIPAYLNSCSVVAASQLNSAPACQ